MYDKKSIFCYHVATICSNIYVIIQIKKAPDLPNQMYPFFIT